MPLHCTSLVALGGGAAAWAGASAGTRHLSMLCSRGLLTHHQLQAVPWKRLQMKGLRASLQADQPTCSLAYEALGACPVGAGAIEPLVHSPGSHARTALKTNYGKENNGYQLTFVMGGHREQAQERRASLLQPMLKAAATSCNHSSQNKAPPPSLGSCWARHLTSR